MPGPRMFACGITPPPSIQKVFQLFAAGGMAQFPQGLGLDLADAFSCHIELFAHLFQSAGAAVLNAEAQAQHLSLIHI